ncbi:glycosyl transferase family group 2-domain-containing protein [Flagelloscypha sp. PMI_526]|nr:glycosyl transferase family group 2-domain-containing protein [Flagelloscypha sp. PMI_526]
MLRLSKLSTLAFSKVLDVWYQLPQLGRLYMRILSSSFLVLRVDLSNWFFRAIPALSTLFWILLCFLALRKQLPSLWPWAPPFAVGQHDWGHLSVWEWLYLGYSLLAHVCGCMVFQGRLLWSVWRITGQIRLAKEIAKREIKGKHKMSSLPSESGASDEDFSLVPSPRSSSDSTLYSPTLDVLPLKVASLSFADISDAVRHAIVLPSYKEDVNTLRETLLVLASHVLAKTSYDVYLAMEERDSTAKNMAATLIDAFRLSFRSISCSFHPGDIPGEAAGKSSNVSWAARNLGLNYRDSRDRDNCIITIMDSDTHLSSNYFLLLSKHHREDCEPWNNLYVVPIIFDRNSQSVNPLVRAADIFWCGAGLSGVYEGSSVMIPTSVYSIPLVLAEEVGGWDTGPDSIGEDMHMFLKCYFQTKGQLKTKIVYSPASQSNVSSGLKGIRGSIDNMKARYNQALRHMWGSLDSGYALRCGTKALFSRDASSITLSTEPSTDAVFLQALGSSPIPARRTGLPWVRTFLVYHRLYEAHFLPSHITIALVSAIIFTSNVSPEHTNPLLLWSLDVCGYLRLVGFLATALYIALYERYHAVAVNMREEEMQSAGLWTDMQDGFAKRQWVTNWTDYIVLPVNGTLYGTVPALIAQMSHLWTTRLTYTVSAKPPVMSAEDRIALVV